MHTCVCAPGATHARMHTCVCAQARTHTCAQVVARCEDPAAGGRARRVRGKGVAASTAQTKGARSMLAAHTRKCAHARTHAHRHACMHTCALTRVHTSMHACTYAGIHARNMHMGSGIGDGVPDGCAGHELQRIDGKLRGPQEPGQSYCNKLLTMLAVTINYYHWLL